MALSVSFFPTTLTTYAVMYGCDEKTIHMISDRLSRSDYVVSHPMILPILIADMERDRHVALLRQNVTRTVQRIYDLTVNRKNFEAQSDYAASSLLAPGDGDSVVSWLDMNYLKNGLQNWQRQIKKMTAHLETVDMLFEHDGLSQNHPDVEGWKSTGHRIKQRLEELIDEYDEHIREATTLVDGLSLAASTVSITQLFF